MEDEKALLQKALFICYNAHRDQKDKGGAPYFLHPVFVALNVSGYKEKIVALLHDVIEDTPTTIDDLRREGFPPDVIEAINTITKKGESYEDYLKAVRENALARAVKIEDIKHNSDASRIPNPTEKDIKRRGKYKKALEYLEG